MIKGCISCVFCRKFSSCKSRFFWCHWKDKVKVPWRHMMMYKHIFISMFNLYLNEAYAVCRSKLYRKVPPPFFSCLKSHLQETLYDLGLHRHKVHRSQLLRISDCFVGGICIHILLSIFITNSNVLSEVNGQCVCA